MHRRRIGCSLRISWLMEENEDFEKISAVKREHRRMQNNPGRTCKYCGLRVVNMEDIRK